VAGDEGFWIGVLGPLSGARGGTPVKMPLGRPGVLLAVLAMSAGHPVGVSRLAELIWSRCRIRRGLLPGARRIRPRMTYGQVRAPGKAGRYPGNGRDR
jgi:hypothetical protein